MVKSRYSCVSSVAGIADYNHDGCWGYFCGACGCVGCLHADGLSKVGQDKEHWLAADEKQWDQQFDPDHTFKRKHSVD